LAYARSDADLIAREVGNGSRDDGAVGEVERMHCCMHWVDLNSGYNVEARLLEA
jgi:hypothetical protein